MPHETTKPKPHEGNPQVSYLAHRRQLCGCDECHATYAKATA